MNKQKRNIRFYYKKNAWEYQLYQDIESRLLAKRIIQKNDDFFWVKRAELEGSILITCEAGKGVLKRQEELQEKFPEANILALYSGNVKDHQDQLTLLRQGGRTEIDVLIVSPTWCYGIDIQSNFSATYFDGTLNPQFPLTIAEVYQFCGRARTSTSIHLCIHYKKKSEHIKEFKSRIHFDRNSTNEELHLAYEQLEISGRNDWTPDKELSKEEPVINLVPVHKPTLLIKMYRHKEKFFSDIYRAKQLKEHFQRAGDIVENWDDYLWSLNDSERKRINQLLEKQHLIQNPDIPESDLGRQISEAVRKRNEERKSRRSALDNPNAERLGESLELIALMRDIRKLFATITMNQYLITNEQIIRSKEWKEIYQKKDIWNAIFDTYSWDIQIENKTKLEPMRTLARLLLEFNYEVFESQGGDKADYKLAMKEHNSDFAKWKKTNPQIEGKTRIRYEDYLFSGMNEGFLEYAKLKRETKKFIRSFPHLLIKEIGAD